MQAQLNITNYYVDRIAIQTNDHYKQSEMVAGKINVDFDIKRSNENPLDFIVFMFIELNKNDDDFALAEYRIMLNIVGFYNFAEGTDEATINNMIAPSGLSILYGMARGVVSQITGNCRHGKFILPTLNFMEIIRNKFKKPVETSISPPVEGPPMVKKVKTA
jgi:preprotein translocase subunit SecB